MAKEIEEDALIKTREELSKLIEKDETPHSRQIEEEKKSLKLTSSSFKRLKKFDTESDDERLLRSFENSARSFPRPSVKNISPVKLENKLKRSSILYKRPVAKLSEVRKYILHSTDDERAYLSSS